MDHPTFRHVRALVSEAGNVSSGHIIADDSEVRTGAYRVGAQSLRSRPRPFGQGVVSAMHARPEFAWHCPPSWMNLSTGVWLSKRSSLSVNLQSRAISPKRRNTVFASRQGA